ncbi:hypothetical protein V7161_20995 [Neobacillus drentensis]|uniref:hypothetical protein n=1 Tax=Neobacillus drentensis TaxID=220684 RepID=UPI0030011742
MNKKLLFFSLVVCISLSFILINSLKTGAESKKTLEEMVMDQQMTIEKLQSQLTETQAQLTNTQERLATIENKQTGLDQYESRLSKLETTIGQWDSDETVSQQISRIHGLLDNRITYLEKLHSIDKASIQDYVGKLPTTMRNELSMSIDMSATECQMRGDCTELPLHVEYLWANIGNSNYNLLDYISKEQIIDIAKAAYNDVKQPEKVIPQKINIYINQPFQTSTMTIEVPLD